uniref:Uncharacterized protein n=1 Tax=Trypanosoma vivax (strain Y486) TaxID=1055687 RepID=G0TTQ7_TRYVY|nr:hypothetical protein TVY486_0400020 [Trypanosoma vivax Y486]
MGLLLRGERNKRLLTTSRQERTTVLLKPSTLVKMHVLCKGTSTKQRMDLASRLPVWSSVSLRRPCARAMSLEPTGRNMEIKFPAPPSRSKYAATSLTGPEFHLSTPKRMG